MRDVWIDGKAMMQRVRTERDRFVRLTQKSFDEIPDGVRLRGVAKFMGTQTLSLDDGRLIEAGSIVIATGSSPSVPDAFAKLGNRILTNETIFDLQDLPNSLAVMG